MLVPLALSMLANRHGWLSAEMALGWRLARLAAEMYDGLEQVRIAARGHAETLMALRALACCPTAGEITEPDGPRPWDVLFWHLPTGSALKVVCVKRLVSLPPELRALEEGLEQAPPLVVARYRTGLDGLIQEILGSDPERYCRISRHRFHTLSQTKRAPLAGCPWCHRRGVIRLVEVDGRVCCPSCSGLEPSWLERGLTAAVVRS
ncbi:MAG: hypothetical protein BWK76_09790 [Desulfobulbaceae bacterium A2]|nr:MAG: hypothetical protein BWK76_09790 [Desulfobulbaceae bacterium A2]